MIQSNWGPASEQLLRELSGVDAHIEIIATGQKLESKAGWNDCHVLHDLTATQYTFDISGIDIKA